MSKIKLAVLFGGASSEYSISLLSAASVLRNLDKEKYEIFQIGITRDGRWLYYTGPVDAIEDGTWTEDADNKSCMIPADPSSRCIVVMDNSNISYLSIEAVFPVLHGRNGEDGAIQGLLTMSGLPYVGCGVLASANCMDKGVTNTLLQAAGIPQAKFVFFQASEAAQAYGRVEAELGYPVFVKPANAGSSVGISKAYDRAGLESAVALAAVHDSKIVVEEAVDAIEVECAVLGNSEPEVSPVGEIAPASDFYDFEAKYLDDNTALYIPARLDPDTTEKIRGVARKAYQVMGCQGMARVDFFVRRSDGAVLLNELNTIPGFTSISMYPKVFAQAGVSYPQLLDRLIALAIERAGE